MKKPTAMLIIITAVLLCGCSKNVLNPNKPVTLNIWHNYGSQMKTTMDQLIDEFNSTIGVEEGIILNVTSISGSATLHEKLVMAANSDPNAPELPDITTLYPKTAIILSEKSLLADMSLYFTEEELSLYVPEFLKEGYINDRLYVFPTAKSTEVIYVNETIFNKLMRDTDVSYDDLKTFEGINRAAKEYYEWTDSQTPGIKNDGKAFLVYDSIFNMSQMGYEQLGESFLSEDKINYSSPAFERIWNTLYEPMVKGYFAIFDGYGSDLAKTGDVLCSVGSTAGVLFYPPTITYPDNVVEPVTYSILPYPTFEDGKKIALQRGGGMCVIKSTKEKEYAASIFLKWFTDPKQNLRFISSTGYLPVTTEAFNKTMSEESSYVSNENIKKLLASARLMQQEYEFFIPPVFDSIDELQKQYEASFKQNALESREDYLSILEEKDEHSAYEAVSQNVMSDFIKKYGVNSNVDAP